MRLFIHPFDTQFYRDGRPFDAGVDSTGKANFLPYPRTLYGALRACILSYYSDWQNWPSLPKVQSVIGSSPEQFGSLSIRGPVLARDRSGDLTNIYPLYPIPADVVRAKATRKCLLLKPQTDKTLLKNITNFQFNELFPCRPASEERIENIEGYLLSHDYLPQYLIGEFPKGNDEITLLEKVDKVFQFEPRLGIGLNYKTRTAKLNLLYSVNHVRMDDDVGLIVEVDNHNELLPLKGLLRLGGDSRPVEYTKIKNEDWERTKEDVGKMIIKEGKFKVYLITPALFKNSWYPDFLSSKKGFLEGNLPGTSLCIRLVGACVGRSISIGGFDIKNKHPKEIQKAVPAGSVYFFQFTDWNSLTNDERNTKIYLLLNNFFYKSLTDGTQLQANLKEGFGLALIGGW